MFDSAERGGNRERVLLDDAHLTTPHRDLDLIALDEALERLAAEQLEIARLVSLRCFAGFSTEQTALALGTSLRTTE